MKKLNRYLVAGFLPLALLSSGAMAKMGHHGGGQCGLVSPAMLSELDLSSEQETQVKAIMDGLHKQFDKESMAAERLALLKADKFDEAAAKALIDKREQRREEHQLQMFKAQYQIYQLLTPEQKAEYEQEIAECQSHKQKHQKKGYGQRWSDSSEMQ